jgi:hypothetical protein
MGFICRATFVFVVRGQLVDLRSLGVFQSGTVLAQKNKQLIRPGLSRWQ